MLKSKLRESQTQLAVFRTEIANLKSEYDEQGERLSRWSLIKSFICIRFVIETIGSSRVLVYFTILLMS